MVDFIPGIVLYEKESQLLRRSEVMKEELTGKVQTVLGLVEADSLGIILPHEHILIDVSASFNKPTGASEQALAYQPVSLENLNWIRHNWTKNLDNNALRDEQTAIDEVMYYKKAGGDTIVELSASSSLGRDPRGLMRISRATGLNIIMGTGFYGVYQGQEAISIADMSEEDFAKQMIQEITVGVGDTGLRAGILGEMGMAWPLSKTMRMALRSGAYAQKRTGAALNIHPPLYTSTREPYQSEHEDVVMEVIEILDNAGADLNRTIISHVDVCCFTSAFRRKLAETGCYIEYDQFGLESYPDEDDFLWAMPSDAQRIDQLVELIAEGYLNKILVSCDLSMKHQLKRYGGWGYDHILTSVVPLMRHKGVSRDQIHTLLVENPKRVLAFAPVAG
jgi:phosphotriesterase-related protein